MSTPRLEKIYIYPVKSLAGIELSSSTVTPLGLEYDRRWMIVDTKQRFVTQRLYPQLSLIKTAIDQDHIVLSLNGVEQLRLPLTLPGGNQLTVQVWHDQVQSVVADQASNAWISQYLGIDCYFVYMPDESRRAVDPEFAVSAKDVVSFADGFPFLLISEASLEDLNEKLSARGEMQVAMQRFRPNMVVSGTEAFAEDNWKSFWISGNLMHGVKPCSRCVMTTIDPEVGQKGIEPLATLLEYRKSGQRAYFGQNVLVDLEYENSWRLNVGDEIEVC